jgi:hypothetical protein
VTRRGVKRTYSASVGSWMRYEEPFDDRTICLGSLPMMSACLRTPLWLCVVLEDCNFTSSPSLEASLFSRRRTTSPSVWLLVTIDTNSGEFLPWKARPRCRLVEKDLALVGHDRTGRRNWLKIWCRITSHEGWRMECRRGPSPQSEASPSPHYNHMHHMCHVSGSRRQFFGRKTATNICCPLFNVQY